MADQKRLPSEVLVVEQARIAAALAIREEIARLEKLAAGLVVSARSNLTAEFGDVVTQVICDKIVDVFAESGLPENCIAAIPGLAEQLDIAHAATSDPTSIALDTSLITGAWLSTFQASGEPDPDDHPPHDFYGLILNGRNAIVGHQIVEEARAAAQAGSDGKKHPYSRLFGRHSWKKEVYQAAFNEALGLPIIPVVAAPGSAPPQRPKTTRVAPDLQTLEPAPKVFPDPPIDGEVGTSANSEPRPEPTPEQTSTRPVPSNGPGAIDKPVENAADIAASPPMSPATADADTEDAGEADLAQERVAGPAAEVDEPVEQHHDVGLAADAGHQFELEAEAVETPQVPEERPSASPTIEARATQTQAPADDPQPTAAAERSSSVPTPSAFEAQPHAGEAIGDEDDMTFGDPDDLDAPAMEASERQAETLAVVVDPNPEPDLTGFLPSFMSDQDDGPPATSVTGRSVRSLPPPPPGRRPMRVAPGL